MSAAGLPTIQVLLDDADNGGTWPYDITAYARLTEGYTITRGRADELSQVSPGQLTLTLDNTDGRFSLGSTVGGYGAVNINRGIRLKVTANGTAYTRFTGYVQEWPVQWPDGSDLFALVTVTAVDAMARWSRYTLRSVLEEEVLLDSPQAYYTLGEPAGATVAADSSGRGASPLRVAGSGAPVTFGTAIGPGTDGLTAASFGGGEYLHTQGQFTLTSAELWFSTTATSIVIADFCGLTMAVDSSGFLFLTTAFAVNDGLTHLLSLTWNESLLRYNVYVDGVMTGSWSFGHKLAGALGVGGDPTFNGYGPFAGTIAHVALYDTTLSPTRISAHMTAGRTGFANERTDQRASRLLAYTHGTPGTLDVGMTTLPFHDWAGSTISDAIEEVVDAEMGVAYIDGSGLLAFHNRQNAALRTSPDLTLVVNSDILDPGIGVQADTQTLINSATATRTGDGAPTQTVKDAASVATNGTYSQSYTYLVSTDDEARARIEWIVTTHAEPAARTPELILDLMSADATAQASIMALDIDSRIQITGMPAQTPSGTTLDVTVAGWTETLSLDGWTWQANALSWAQLSQAWVLGDTTYGVLDNTTRLGV